MKIKFISVELYNYYTGNYKGKQKISELIIKRFIDKVNFIINAGTLGDLSKINSLNIEKYEDHYSARINKQYRIEFDFAKPDTIVFIKISKHYE